ncbi:MAG: hypothetical protein HY815_20100, partial [Candidatus Riflebacteria bacterium]|nr:hypothetical protein [Candidatus Riflebacteria bacterium]
MIAAVVIGFTTLRDAREIRLREEALRLRYQQAQRNLSISHAAWAAAEQSAGRPDSARHHAALAFKASRGAPAGFRLPDGPVHSIFATRAAAGPLLWTCSLDATVCDLFFEPGSTDLCAVTTSTTHWTFPLTDTRRFRQGRLTTEPVWSVVRRRDGPLFATSTLTGDIQLWTPGHPPRRLGGPGEKLAGVSLSGDGTLLATGMRGRTVRLFDPRTGQPRGDLPGHRSEIWAMQFGPDGRVLATCGRDGEICLWDVPGARLTRRLVNPAGAALALAFSPDSGRLVSTASDGRLRVWDLATGGLVRTLGQGLGNVLSLAWSPDGRWLASGGQDFTVRIWSLDTGEERASLSGHTHWVWRLAFSADSRILASGAEGGTLCLWDVAQATKNREEPSAAAGIHRLAFSADARFLATVHRDSRVSVWDVATAQEVTRRTLDFEVRDAALTPDLTVVAAGLGKDRLIRSELPGRRTEVALCGGPSTVLALSPDGKILAVSGPGGVTRVFTGPLSGEGLAVRTGKVRSLTFDAAGRLATGGPGTLCVWDATTGRLLRELPRQSQEVTSLAFSSDGRRLVSGAEDSTIRLFDLGGGSRILGRQLAWIWSIAVSPENDVLVSSSADSMRVWRISSGQRLSMVDQLASPVRAVALSPRGAVL